LADRLGFWFGKSAWIAWFLVVVLITTVILQLLTQYALNFWNRDFFDAIGPRDREELWTQALRFVPLAAASLTLMILQVRARMTRVIEENKWTEAELRSIGT
jgi:vitamin B12/bleomycin/antimicrobial peptide transport system ATP-binding/permease protein